MWDESLPVLIDIRATPSVIDPNKRDVYFLWAEKLSIINLYIILKLIYRFNAVPKEIPEGGLFLEIFKLNQ